MGSAVERRIGALKPGYYTRIGTAVRHASAQLVDQPQRKKLLLVLTDGKPNDVDHYEGRFAVEDTRKACGRRDGWALRCSASRSTQARSPTFQPCSGAAATPSSATSAGCRQRFPRSIASWPAEARPPIRLRSQTADEGGHPDDFRSVARGRESVGSILQRSGPRPPRPCQLDRSGVFGADWPAGRLEHRKVKCYIIYCVEHMLW